MEQRSRAIQEVIGLNEDELYLEIGRYLHGRGAFPPNRTQLIEMARRWTNEKLVPVVCGSERLQALATQDAPQQELILAISAVLDIASHLLGGVPAVTAAALVARVGLHGFCSTYWNRHTRDKVKL